MTSAADLREIAFGLSSVARRALAAWAEAGRRSAWPDYTMTTVRALEARGLLVTTGRRRGEQELFVVTRLGRRVAVLLAEWERVD